MTIRVANPTITIEAVRRLQKILAAGGTPTSETGVRKNNFFGWSPTERTLFRKLSALGLIEEVAKVDLRPSIIAARKKRLDSAEKALEEYCRVMALAMRMEAIRGLGTFTDYLLSIADNNQALLGPYISRANELRACRYEYNRAVSVETPIFSSDDMIRLTQTAVDLIENSAVTVKLSKSEVTASMIEDD